MRTFCTPEILQILTKEKGKRNQVEFPEYQDIRNN